MTKKKPKGYLVASMDENRNVFIRVFEGEFADVEADVEVNNLRWSAAKRIRVLKYYSTGKRTVGNQIIHLNDCWQPVNLTMLS